ncbi:MAG TPA: rhodanese-like domain-containing protein [Pyrinomonadaceae bacterium]|nr:rhodanese-like domain-containing protein [Pyrinomonadaceae bacterium]
MSRAKGSAALALAAALASAVAGCKATDHAEQQGRASNASANAARNNTARTNANANTPPYAQFTPPDKTAAPSDTHDIPAPDVRRVSIDEARALVERGEAVFVDVRGDDAFRNGHLPGAISIPANDVVARASELPAGKQVITYCA